MTIVISSQDTQTGSSWYVDVQFGGLALYLSLRGEARHNGCQVNRSARPLQQKPVTWDEERKRLGDEFVDLGLPLFQ